MSMSQGHSARDQLRLAFEVDNAHVAPAPDQNVAIGALERRTCDDAVSTRATRSSDPVRNSLQPWPSIFIRQRLAAMHLLDIGPRVEPIGVFVGPAQATGQHGGNRALART